MSFILLGILNSQASGVANAYFMQTLGNTYADALTDVYCDANDNIYVVEELGASPYQKLSVTKLDPNGALLWTKSLSSTGNFYAGGVTVDASGNVYVGGRANISSYDYAELAKYDTNGNISWQRRFRVGPSSMAVQRVTTDASGNVYVSGYTSILAWSMKLDSNGTRIWDYRWGNPISGRTTQGSSIGLTSTGITVVCGFQTGGNTYPAFQKLATDGSSLGYFRDRIGSNSTYANDMKINSSDLLITAGHHDITGFFSVWGAWIGVRDLSDGSRAATSLSGTNQEYGNGLAIDSTGAYIMVGSTNNQLFISKWNGTTIDWQRRITVGSGQSIGYKVTTNSLNDIIVVGKTNGTGAGDWDGFLVKVPSDGSLTGTYVLNGQNAVYEAGTMTVTAKTLSTAGVESWTEGVPSFYTEATSYTDASETLTQYTVEM